MTCFVSRNESSDRLLAWNLRHRVAFRHPKREQREHSGDKLGTLIGAAQWQREIEVLEGRPFGYNEVGSDISTSGSATLASITNSSLLMWTFSLDIDTGQYLLTLYTLWN